MKRSVPSPISGVLWLQLLGWGTEGEVHVSLEEYDTTLHTGSPVFVVNFEQVSYLILLRVFESIFKMLIRLEHAYTNEKFILKECYP